jgi:PAS domain S-box-containing protein
MMKKRTVLLAECKTEPISIDKENLKSYIDASPFGIEIVDPEGKLIYANKASLQIWGYDTIEEFRELSFGKLFAAESLKTTDRIKHNIRNGLADQYDVAIVRKDGEIRELHAYTGFLTWDGEKCSQITFLDVTERKKVEDALAFKTALLEAEAENTSEGILVLNEHRKKVFCNRRYCEMWQIPEAIKAANDDERALKHILSQLKNPEEFPGKNPPARQLDSRQRRLIELKDGRIFEGYSSPMVDAQKVYRGRVIYYRDITEPVTMREKLERAAEEWRTTFDSISDRISIHDKNNKLLRVNKAFARKFGLDPREVIGKNCRELAHPDSPLPKNCPWAHTLRTKKPSMVEVYQPDKGSWFQESSSPLFDDKGELIGTVNIIKDVTELKQMEQQLIMTDRLASIGELVSGIAHELNNPLTGVIGFSQLLMEKEVDEDIREDLVVVAGEAQRAAKIVKNLLTFARKHAPVKQPSRINTILEDVLNLRAYEQKVSNIEVITQLDPELPEVMVDYFQIQQVFLNIVINAEYFMIEAHKKGTLTITSERLPGHVRVTISDDGPGIPPENVKRIFDPFFTTKEVGKGTGLGLSICHGIVTEHGGKIYVESLNGKGATFVVELPIEK